MRFLAGYRHRSALIFDGATGRDHARVSSEKNSNYEALARSAGKCRGYPRRLRNTCLSRNRMSIDCRGDLQREIGRLVEIRVNGSQKKENGKFWD